MDASPEALTVDNELFEYAIAYNCTLDEIYLATIIDALDLSYLTSSGVAEYINILFTYYRARSTLPSPAEIKTYLSTDDLKSAYKTVVTKFKEFDGNFNTEELLTNTERYIRERAVFRAVKDTITEVHKQRGIDSAKIFQRFESACNISLIDDLGFDYLNQIDDHIADLKRVDAYLPTGYKWLDKMLGGGFLEGGRAVYSWMGATNSGKSIVLGNLAANILKQERTVVVLTLEMPEFVYSKRISSKLTSIPISTLQAETTMLKDQLYKLKNSIPNGRLIIKEFPPHSITCANIKAYLQKLQQQKKIKIDAVVIDYLTLLKAGIKVDGLYESGKCMAEEVRALSYPVNFGCPFLTAMQANRSAYDVEDPGLNTTGESMGIPMTVDFQASVWSTPEDRELGIIKMGIQKSRFGPNFGVQGFRVNYDTLSIDESDDVFSDTDDISDIDRSFKLLSD